MELIHVEGQNLDSIRSQAYRAAAEVCEAAKLKKGDLFVVGCSTSEVLGEKIGTYSSMDAAGALFEGISKALGERGIYLAAQCCEHLGRALIVERDACDRFRLEEVNVIPQPKAGGSFGTTAWKRFRDPVAVEGLRQSASADWRGGYHMCPPPAEICRRLQSGLQRGTHVRAACIEGLM